MIRYTHEYAAGPLSGYSPSFRGPDHSEHEFSPSFGGYLDTFQLQDPQVRYSVYVPRAVMGSHEVDALVYVHGLLYPCPPAPKNVPADLTKLERAEILSHF